MTKNGVLLFEMIVIMFSGRQKPRENKISRVNRNTKRDMAAGYSWWSTTSGVQYARNFIDKLTVMCQ